MLDVIERKATCCRLQLTSPVGRIVVESGKYNRFCPRNKSILSFPYVNWVECDSEYIYMDTYSFKCNMTRYMDMETDMRTDMHRVMEMDINMYTDMNMNTR
jgi:hypothetical protein